jgi:hypothetical protein
MADKENLPPRDFVDALVEDPANPPQLQVLTGYPGRSAEEGHTRLYLDPELTGWVDIPDEAILLRREVQDEYGLGKSLVWTKLDAQIKQGPGTGGGTGADFLQGQVAQDLGGGAGLGGAQPIRSLIGCPTHAPFLCPVTPPRLCPPRTPLQGCPSLGIACTHFPPCPPRTLTPEQCPTLGFTCTSLPSQCPQQTVNPLQCPSLGIACTHVPPCPPRTQTPEQCPTLGFTCTALPPQCPQRTINPDQCPTLGIACIPSRIQPCETQDAFRCIPQPTSNPQFCPVATPVGGCPGGGIGDPGGPVEFGQQGAQGFAGQAQAQIDPAFRIHTAFCPFPRTVFEIQCQITNQTPCLPRSGVICQPMSPWCPITFPITGPGPTTTPVQLTGQFGGGQFGGAVQGMGAQALNFQQVSQFCPVLQQPSVQICAAPTLGANCLQNTRNQICQITVVTRPDVCQTGWPTIGVCPSLACPTQGCPFGGGGGFGGGF